MSLKQEIANKLSVLIKDNDLKNILVKISLSKNIVKPRSSGCGVVNKISGIK